MKPSSLHKMQENNKIYTDKFAKKTMLSLRKPPKAKTSDVRTLHISNKKHICMPCSL